MPKNKPNSYFCFMMEYKENLARHGVLITMKEAADQASPFWMGMPVEERQPYVDKAKSMRSDKRKLTSYGVPIDWVDREKIEEDNYRSNMLKCIAITIDEAGPKLMDLDFFLIHINTFCFISSKKVHYPAEIAISHFNLQSGVIAEDVYHSFINPGKLPLGYAYTVKHFAEESHQIQYPKDSPSNLNVVFEQIVSYLSVKCGDAQNLPPLYTFGVNEQVRSIISTMCTSMGRNKNFIRVYGLDHLFYNLKKAIANITEKDVAYPTISLAVTELEKDLYDHTPKIACEFHVNSEVFKHCSKSIVIRWAYIICDNCCHLLNIPLIPGQHVPNNANITKRVKGCTSKGSNVTLDESFVSVEDTMEYSSTIFEDTTDCNSICISSMSSYYDTRDADVYSCFDKAVNVKDVEISTPLRTKTMPTLRLPITQSQADFPSFLSFTE